jgi:heparan-alpha-glucosaminide N-acetyltransferase
VQQGDVATRRKYQFAHVRRWLLWGVVFGLIGGALCGFSKENGVIPINKNLWSPSFVFVMAGLDFILLSAMYLIVDVYHWGTGSPLCYVGMNSIVIYSGHEILQGFFPFTAFQAVNFASHAEAMASNAAGALCWVMIARYLYLRKIFINI